MFKLIYFQTSLTFVGFGAVGRAGADGVGDGFMGIFQFFSKSALEWNSCDTHINKVGPEGVFIGYSRLIQIIVK